VLLKDSLRAAIERLTAAQVGSSRLNAELLLMFVLGCDRAYLHAHSERALNCDEISRYDQVLAKRESGIPAQYITGHQEFWGMDFIVSPAVLIPRPETEHVIETVVPLAREIIRPKIVDVGTGSGCIALALVKELPDAEIHATDISLEALEIAKANAARLQPQVRMERRASSPVQASTGAEARACIVQFHRRDLLQGFEAGVFDFVVSNPPYVGESEADQVQLQVRKFEPRSAVFAGPTGLEVIERLIPQAHTALKSRGFLVMEISGTIVDGVLKLLADWNSVSLIQDLQGIPRVVLAGKS
jgi:release factor glutamine methyltransferase